MSHRMVTNVGKQAILLLNNQIYESLKRSRYIGIRGFWISVVICDAEIEQLVKNDEYFMSLLSAATRPGEKIYWQLL